MSLQAITLKKEIMQAVKKGFIEIINHNPDIYSFALYSDENCETLSVISNTLEYLKKTKKEYGEGKFDHHSKFSPDEWDFQLTGEDKEFNKLSKRLSNNFLNYDFENNEDEIIFNKFQISFYDICIDILKELKEDHFFKNSLNKEILILFSASEYEFEQSKQMEMVLSLNDNKYSDCYIKWMKTWVDE